MDLERWLPLARQVVRASLRLRWRDVFEVYTYVPTIPLAEALALEARRAGSDTHLTLMTDDLWFTSMRELPTRWLRQPSPAEFAINRAITAYVYLGGPSDARRMRDIPPEKFEANALGGRRQDAPKRRRRVRSIDLPIGRVTRERAEAYGLDFDRWRSSYEAALAVDLREIRKKGLAWARALAGARRVHITSDAGTDLTLALKRVPPAVDDGIVDAADVRREFLEATLPAGKVVAAVAPDSAEGQVRSRDPVFLMGRTVRGLRLRFRKGRLVEWGAEENASLLEGALGKGPAGRLGWFSVGLNPVAEPCMLDNSIVKDDIDLGLGPHPALEPRLRHTGPWFSATIGPSKLEFVERL